MNRSNLKMILFGVLLLYSFTAFTQDDVIDSLQKVLLSAKEDTTKVNTLNAISGTLVQTGDLKNAMQYADEANILSEKTNFKKGKGNACEIIGFIYLGQGNYPEALRNFINALKIREESGDKPGIAQSYSYVGNVYFQQENYSEALKYFYKTLKFYEQTGNKQGIAYSLQFIGSTHYYQENDSEALKNWLACLKIQEEIGDKPGMAHSYNGIGDIYSRQGKYSEALQKHIVALKIYKELNNKMASAWTHGLIGGLYGEQGSIENARGDKATSQKKYSEALKNLLLALKLREEGGEIVPIADSYDAVGNIYIKLKNFSLARNYLQMGLQLAKTTGKKLSLQNSYGSLSVLDSIQRNYQQAYEHYKMHILYRDSLNNQESIRKSEQIKMQYEFDKKEDQIKLLSTENKLKTALAGREGQRKKMAYAGIGIILLSGGYGFYRYRRRKRLQSQQSLMNERLRISRELHDEVGATLSGISMYSHLAKEQIKTAQKEEVEKSLNIMQQSSGEMVNKLNDIVWLINPEQDTLQKLVERLEEYATDIATIKNMKVKITVPEKIAEISLPIESRRNIYLFCKEAINNAVKYSQGSLLELSIKEMDGKLEFSVSDNGKGFDAVMVRRGNGLENMQKRADEIGARLLLQSKLDGGTLVSMQLKIT